MLIQLCLSNCTKQTSLNWTLFHFTFWNWIISRFKRVWLCDDLKVCDWQISTVGWGFQLTQTFVNCEWLHLYDWLQHVDNKYSKVYPGVFYFTQFPPQHWRALVLYLASTNCCPVHEQYYNHFGTPWIIARTTRCLAPSWLFNCNNRVFLTNNSGNNAKMFTP